MSHTINRTSNTQIHNYQIIDAKMNTCHSNNPNS